jgi:hypothetical protein
MADPEHVARLIEKGVDAWNARRAEHPWIPSHMNWRLNKADLSDADLSGADLTGANLGGVNLSGMGLCEANLRQANLSGANLSSAHLSGADLGGTDLSGASLNGANLNGAYLGGTDLSGASLNGANLRNAVLRKTNLDGADLSGANLSSAHLSGADLSRADLTPPGKPGITVDDIEVAQFIYLMLHNQKIRKVIDTITSKAVLILGRFTAERKAVLDALREELRKRDYVPILFDFDKPASKDLTATVSTLAHLARRRPDRPEQHPT